MASLKFEKRLNSLPGTLTPDTVYMVYNSTSVRMYISNAAGNAAVPVVGAIEGIDPLLFSGVKDGSGL